MVRFASLFLCLALVGGNAHALYDDKPDAALYAVQGAWQGTLTYKDYRRPDRSVTLPTTLFIALAAPDELVLHYAFDDGPGKTVYSYERMRFDIPAKRIAWTTGLGDRTETVGRITSDAQDGAIRRIVFESDEKGEAHRYTLEVGARSLSLQKEELPANGPVVLRNRFTFAR